MIYYIGVSMWTGYLNRNVQVVYNKRRCKRVSHLSKAFTLPSSFLLLRQLISTWVLFLTDWVSTDKGPVWNSSSSRFANSSGLISDLGFVVVILRKLLRFWNQFNCWTNILKLIKITSRIYASIEVGISVNANKFTRVWGFFLGNYIF